MTYQTVIQTMYMAAMDEHPWQDVLDQTAALFNASGAFLFTTDIPAADGGMAIFSGMPAQLATQYLSEVATVDLWYHELLRRHDRLRTGFQWQSDELVAAADLRRTRFYADYLAPSDIGRTLGAMIGDGTEGMPPLMPLCLYRSVKSRPFTTLDENRLRSLRPHLTRAMTIRGRLNTCIRDSNAIAFDRMTTAVVVLAADRKIILANAAAAALFSRTAFRLSSSGRLSCSSPSQIAALDSALKDFTDRQFNARTSYAVRLCGPVGGGIVANLVPAPEATRTLGRITALAFLKQEGQISFDIESAASSLYSLTPAETSLVTALFEGATAESFAQARGVGVATVRTQLRAVFSKTGTGRQAELLRLLYSIAS